MSRRKTDSDSRMLDLGDFALACTPSAETGKIVHRRRRPKGGTLHQYVTARRPSQPDCLPQIPSPRVEKEPLQRHTSLPAIVDVKTEALLLSRQLHLDFHEVKHAVQELRKEHAELANGGSSDFPLMCREAGFLALVQFLHATGWHGWHV